MWNQLIFLVILAVVALGYQVSAQTNNTNSCLTYMSQEIQVCLPQDSQGQDFSNIFEVAMAQYRNYIQGKIELTGDQVIAFNKTINKEENNNEPFTVQQCTCDQIASMTLGLNVVPEAANSSADILGTYFNVDLTQYLDQGLLTCSQYTDPTPAIGPCLKDPSESDCIELNELLTKYGASSFTSLLDYENSDAKNLGGEVTIFAPNDDAYTKFIKDYQAEDPSTLTDDQKQKIGKIAMNHIVLDVNRLVDPMFNDTTLLSAVSQSPSQYFQCEKRGFLTVIKVDKEPTKIISPGSTATILVTDQKSCRNISLNIIDTVLVPCPEGSVDNTEQISNIEAEGASAQSVQNSEPNLDCPQEQQIFNCNYQDQISTFSRSEMYQLFNCLGDANATALCDFRGEALQKDNYIFDVVKNGQCVAECTNTDGTPDTAVAPISVDAPVEYNTTDQTDNAQQDQASTSGDNQAEQTNLDTTFANASNCEEGQTLVYTCDYQGTTQVLDNLVEDAYKGCMALDPVPPVCHNFLQQDVDGQGHFVFQFVEGNCTSQCLTQEERAGASINEKITESANATDLLDTIHVQSPVMEEAKANPQRLYSLVVNNTLFYPFFSKSDECSKQCGGGFESNTPFCYSKDTGLMVPLEQCGGNLTAEILNILVTDCNTQPCSGVNWTVGEWSSCSALCGTDNFQSRVVDCLNYDSNEKVDDALCDNAFKPEFKRACANNSCDQIMWVTGGWGPCKGGYKSRQVTCQYFNGTQVPGELCTEKLQYSRAEKAVCYDYIKGNPSSCPEGYVGYDCEVYNGDCSKITLKSGQVCCNTGIVGFNGQCCATGVADSNGQCCEEGYQGQMPVIDSQGACCTEPLDYAGQCGGNTTQIDVLGQLCQGAVDASGICCPSITYLDDLGVCNGNNSDGVFKFQIRTNPRKLVNNSVDALSPNFLKQQLQDSLRTYEYNVDKITVTPYGDDIVFYDAVFEGPLNRSLDYTQLYVLFDLQLSKFADLGSISKKYRANNGICEIGEFNTTDSNDCNEYAQALKDKTLQTCGSGGIFVKGTGTCACYVGYEGDNCLNCSAGYIAIKDTCILDSWGVKQLSEAYNRKHFQGMTAGIVVGVVVFIIILVCLVVFFCIRSRRRSKGALFQSSKQSAARSGGIGAGLSKLFNRGSGYQKGKLGDDAREDRGLPISTNASDDVVGNGNGLNKRKNVSWNQNPVGGKFSDPEANVSSVGQPNNDNKLSSALSTDKNNYGQSGEPVNTRDDESLINFHDVDDDSSRPKNGNNGVKPDMWIQNTSYTNKK